MKITKPELTEAKAKVNVEAGVIKPTQFIEMPYKCDCCGLQTKIKLPVDEYGEYDIDAP